jgi:hypothetical protein
MSTGYWSTNSGGLKPIFKVHFDHKRWGQWGRVISQKTVNLSYAAAKMPHSERCKGVDLVGTEERFPLQGTNHHVRQRRVNISIRLFYKYSSKGTMVPANIWLGKIYEPKRKEVTTGCRKMHNEQRHDLYYSLSTIRIIRSGGDELSRCIGRWERKNKYRILVQKPKGKSQV